MPFDSKIVALDTPLPPAFARLSPAYEVITDNPVEAAERIAALYSRSCEAYIDFAEALAIWLKRFPSKEKQLPFLNRLAELHVLSQRDVMVLSRPNGMLSMIKKIGENADWLRHGEILPLLVPEPSKLYQILLFRDDLKGRFDRTLARLKTLEPGYTRDDIIALRQEAIPSNTADANARSCNQSVIDDRSLLDGRVGDSKTTTGFPEEYRTLLATSSVKSQVAAFASDPPAFNLIGAHPTTADLRRLRVDFANANELDRLLARPMLAPQAAVVVFAKLADTSVVETRLLPHLGFTRLTHLFMIGQPTGSDLADYQVALVSIRGLSCTIPGTPLSRDSSPLALAEQLFPTAEHKAHMFGQPGAGWDAFGWLGSDA